MRRRDFKFLKLSETSNKQKKSRRQISSTSTKCVNEISNFWNCLKHLIRYIITEVLCWIYIMCTANPFNMLKSYLTMWRCKVLLRMWFYPFYVFEKWLKVLLCYFTSIVAIYCGYLSSSDSIVSRNHGVQTNGVSLSAVIKSQCS